MTSDLRVGVIGCGFIGERHCRVLERLDGVSVAAVVDELAARAETAAARCGAARYDRHADMLDAERLDAVFVCVPPYAHGELELELVERGLPFFVEKPLASDLETAERVFRAVEAAGLTTAVGYHWRHLDTVARAQALLAATPARLAVGRWWDTTPPPTWWRRRDRSGGQLVEQATHLFDLVRVLIGEPSSVATVASRADRPAYPDADIDDAAAVTLGFPSGAVAAISATCVLAGPHAIGLTVMGEGLAVDIAEDHMVVSTASGTEVVPAGVDPFVAEDADFLRAVRDGTSAVRAPYADALRTHRLAAAAANGA